MKKYYDALGLKKNDASQKEIQDAYEKLSKELDPVKNDNQEFFIEEYKKIKEAYKALTNSSILATAKGDKYQMQDPQKQQPSKTIVMPPKKNKITKKAKLIFAALVGILVVGLGVYMFLISNNRITQLTGLVYESRSTKWMKSQISNDIVLVKDNMKPFSGTLSKIRDNYSGSFVDGKKNGLHREYSGGALIREGKFENSIPVGVHKNWTQQGQLQMEVTFANGKRVGLSKKWNRKGDLLSLDFDQNNIQHYITNYLNSSKALDVIEGRYYGDRNGGGYNFSIIKIFERYYAIMTNNFKNGNDSETKTFEIGDVKAILSKTQEINKYNGWYFMATKSKVPVFVNYDIISNSISGYEYINTEVSASKLFLFFKQ